MDAAEGGGPFIVVDYGRGLHLAVERNRLAIMMSPPARSIFGSVASLGGIGPDMFGLTHRTLTFGFIST